MARSQLILGISSPLWGQTDKIVIFKCTAKLVVSPIAGLALPRNPLERHLMNANSYFSLSFTAAWSPRRLRCFRSLLSWLGRQRKCTKTKRALAVRARLLFFSHKICRFVAFSFSSSLLTLPVAWGPRRKKRGRQKQAGVINKKKGFKHCAREFSILMHFFANISNKENLSKQQWISKFFLCFLSRFLDNYDILNVRRLRIITS